MAPPPPAAEPTATAAVWPGFRGPDRDGVIRGVRIETDWARSPPVELWRRPIGPGWSSFAVRGDLLYTQEQRGDDEIVACYSLSTGEPVWSHRDAARFWESNAGAGPRATPTLDSGRVYTLGATGILNALDARDGAVVWSRNAASDTGTKVPMWGFASSPLVVGRPRDRRRGRQARRLRPRHRQAALGRPGPRRQLQLAASRDALAALPQILLLSAAGATSVAPADGTVLWEYAWPGAAIVQPALTADGDVLISTGSASGRTRHAPPRGDAGPADGPSKSAGRRPG